MAMEEETGLRALLTVIVILDSRFISSHHTGTVDEGIELHK